MNPEIFLSLSLYAHLANIMFVVLALFFVVSNYSYLDKMTPEKKIYLVLLFSIAAGVHGLSHIGLESIYNYNPMGFVVRSLHRLM
jgi:hypothetical protein